MSVPAEQTDDPAHRLGDTLEERYRIDSVLGVGAMGSVYQARHLSLRKDVAVKLLHRQLSDNEEMVRRFDREAAGASRLDHPNCVRVMDFGRTETGHSFLVMELLDGHDVASMIDGGIVPVHRTVEIIGQVLAGLEHAHAMGVVHRDIKPENIYLNRNPDGVMVAKLVDFGIAKITHGEGSTTLTKAGSVFGTPQYMSPEQALGRKIDHRADLYSLGLVMYAMLTGQLPFDGDDPIAILKAQVKKPLPDLPEEVPASIQAFISKMTAKEPEERYAGAAEALEALMGTLAPSPSGGPSQTVASIDPEGAAEVREAAAESPDEDSFIDTVKKRGIELWQQIPQQWRMPAAAGAGILLLVLVIAAASGGDDDDDRGDDKVATADAPAGKDAQKSAAGDSAEPADGGVEEPSEPPDSPSDTAKPAPAKTEAAAADKYLTAGIKTADEFIGAKKYDSARTHLANLIEQFPNRSGLHLRMGHVMNRLRGKGNTNKLIALESYRSALALDSKLLDDPGFEAEFFPLLDKAAFRVRSVEIAVELLGDRGLERLSNWVNVQKSPLPWSQRHLAIDHLRANGRDEWINEALQTALDLWQAPRADDPCGAFQQSLSKAKDNPDSFLAGTIAAVPIPNLSEGEPCPDLAVQLANVQAMYLARYTGVKPVVPEAYRRQASKSR